MELRVSHLRYLLVIYELGQTKPDVGTADIAKAMDCSKASVTNMMSTLMEMGLLVRERYGKIYLTDVGFLLAKDMFRAVEALKARLPALGLELTDGEIGAVVGMSRSAVQRHRTKTLETMRTRLTGGIAE